MQIDGCWASCLNDCGGGISREHFFSECLFKGQSVFVQGFDWCMDKPKEIRIETLTGKILCKHHNERLSELDSSACAALETIKESDRMRHQRIQMPHINWAFKQFNIDGRKFERWFLKTLLNVNFGRQAIIGTGSEAPGVVPDHLVRIAFGLEQFLHGAGLYTAFRFNETFILDHHIHYTGKTREGHLLMGSFRFLGYRFYLNLISQQFTSIEDSSVFYRKTHFNQKIGDRLTLSLSINWPES